ncbi:peptidoglycan-binding protein [Amycolatopsis minnesotensis]|uniref:Peptidoglycan-binding protein n=1 Tax=Amycolatopsis minnesotensis TaxID=337894 RepID=A0ABN2ST65_9PSEU
MSARTNRRARWFVTGAVVVVVLGTVAAVILTRLGGTAAAGDKAPPPPVATATVAKGNLSEEETVDGRLGYGAERSVPGRKQGTVTGLPEAGTVLERGKSVYTVDAKPVPLLYGSLPFYRDLAEGAEDGPDVKELEENLKALGYGSFGRPDAKFTAATATALKKWQKKIGLPETGTFGSGDVIVQPGPVRVSKVSAQPGAPAGGDLMKVTDTTRAVTVQLDQDKQYLAAKGAKVGLDISGGGSATGTITSVTAVPGDGASGDGKSKVEVQITMDDTAGSGQLDSASVSVRFTKGERDGVLTVPVGALLALAEGGYALEVDEGGKRRLLPVQTGLFADGRVEVSGAGVREGMTVVTTS